MIGFVSFLLVVVLVIIVGHHVAKPSSQPRQGDIASFGDYED
jgi:hypothetical protein